jgi:hypothetical protein
MVKEYIPVEPRKCLTPEERAEREENSAFLSLIYRCIECGTERGYGSEDYTVGDNA